MSKNNKKPTKRFCLRKANKYVGWDGKSLVDRPYDAIRASRTWAKLHYPDYELLTFAEACAQYTQALQAAKNAQTNGGGGQ
jgi:hypothetical protein